MMPAKGFMCGLAALWVASAVVYSALAQEVADRSVEKISAMSSISREDASRLVELRRETRLRIEEMKQVQGTEFEKFQQVRALRAKPRNESEVEFLLQVMDSGLKSDPVDWCALGEALRVCGIGAQNTRFADRAHAVILAMTLEAMSEDQVTTMLAAMCVIGVSGSPESVKQLADMTDTRYWGTDPIVSDAFPDLDLRYVFCSQAVWALGMAPSQYSLRVLTGLAAANPETPIKGNPSPSERFAATVHLVLDDVMRIESGEPPRSPGLW